jgi:hypothetical protein
MFWVYIIILKEENNLNKNRRKEKMNFVMEEIKNRLENKAQYEVGDIFEMFGCQYVAVATQTKDPCENCAFADCACMFNVDIPKCDNNVYFRKVKKIVLSIFDKYGMKLSNVEKIENGIVYCENGKQTHIIDLYKYDYIIKPLAMTE